MTIPEKALNLFLFSPSQSDIHLKLPVYGPVIHNLSESFYVPSGEDYWSCPTIPRSVSPGDRGSAPWEKRRSWSLQEPGPGRSSSHQSCWSLSCSRRLRRRVCDPGWRRLSLGWSVHRRRWVLAALRPPSFRVLLRDELEQGGCHGGADVLVGLDF